jgi:hypothetical protein
MWLDLTLDPPIALPPQDLPKPFAMALYLLLDPLRMHVVQQLMDKDLKPVLFI